MNMTTLDLAIVGGGPIGLDAAVRAYARGWDVSVFEKDEIGNHFRRYHEVELFTPFSMNCSEASLSFAKDHGITPPNPDAYLEASDYVEDWLEPLANETDLASCVRTQTEVKSISREGLLKGEEIGSERRGHPPFRLVVDNGEESAVYAQRVIDASGTFGQPNPLGTGGTRAPGENDVDDRIERRFLSEEQYRNWSGQRILLVGAGYSAATNLLWLWKLKQSDNSTEIHWLVRSDSGQPVQRVENDPLEKRDELGKRVNELAREGAVNLIRSKEIHRFEDQGDPIRVEFTDGSTKEVDRILSNVGYRPDRSLYRELQFHECYGTEGPIDLSASLLSQDGADCLDVDPGGVETLENPEPNFYVLGAKSYGRQSNFLLETGFQQVSDLFAEFGDS